MIAQIQYAAPDPVDAVIKQLGRTEDVHFSPSNRRLAIAGFHANKIAVFDIALTRTNGVSEVAIPRVVELHAPFLTEPHGVCFLDEQTLAVANRSGHVHIFDAPMPRTPHERCVVTDRKSIRGNTEALVHTPGSVAAISIDAESLELAVCNNYANYITRHIIRKGIDLEVGSEDVLLAAGLDIPDGICYSPDQRWIAVSNHNTHSVLVYERTAALNRASQPNAILRNVLCPHGIRFTPDGAFILVADASARFVNIYKREEAAWGGVYDPYGVFPVVTPAVFARGRSNPQEGGPKGIDVDKDMNVLVTTCEFQTLAFFDLAEVLGRRQAPTNRHGRHAKWRLEEALHKVHRKVHGALQRSQKRAERAAEN